MVFSGGQADSQQITCITSIQTRIGGKQSLKCVGKNPRLARAKSKNDKNISGLVLGIGRAIGETMAVVMVAGNQPIIPASIFDGVRTMTANIVLEMGYAADLHRGALIATGVVLFVFILLISMLFNAMKKRGERS